MPRRKGTKMLHWNVEDCKGWDTLSEDFQRIVVEATMATGINRITEENLDDWIDRATIMAAFHGPAIYEHKAPHKCLLTDRDRMIKCIGLRTNASEVKSTAKWFKRLHDGVVMTRQWRKREAS